MKLIVCNLATLLFLSLSSQAQKIVLLTNKEGISIRGLSILDNNHAWVSGTKGTIGQTSDGGQTWHWSQAHQYESRDFRDIELIDARTAIIMAIDSPAVILRTTNGGVYWSKVLEDKRDGMFLDAMAFDGKNGIVLGDPINGVLYLAKTKDYGKTWKEVKRAPTSRSGCFAASGTNIIGKKSDYFTVTGGKESALGWNDHGFILPIAQGTESVGANSIAINPNKKGKIAIVIVGGDFNNKERSDSNCVLISKTFFENHDYNFQHPIQNPKGYKSCVTFLDENRLIATGTSGTDISEDGGFHWKHISDIPFHVVQKAKKGNLVLLAGPNGTIAKLEY